MLQEITKWLAATPLSQTIQKILWIIPMMQSVHILAIAIVLSSVGMIDLRIFGLAGGRGTLQETARRFVPWIWCALVVLAVTGSILVRPYIQSFVHVKSSTYANTLLIGAAISTLCSTTLLTARV